MAENPEPKDDGNRPLNYKEMVESQLEKDRLEQQLKQQRYEKERSRGPQPYFESAPPPGRQTNEQPAVSGDLGDLAAPRGFEKAQLREELRNRKSQSVDKVAEQKPATLRAEISAMKKTESARRDAPVASKPAIDTKPKQSDKVGVKPPKMRL